MRTLILVAFMMTTACMAEICTGETIVVDGSVGIGGKDANNPTNQLHITLEVNTDEYVGLGNLWKNPTNSPLYQAGGQTNLFLLNDTCIMSASSGYDASDWIEAIEDAGLLKEVVAKLIADGEVCKQVGHAWRDGRPGEGGGLIFADYHPNTMYRTCKICRQGESQSINDWK